jgi:hypothetical protein
MIGDVSRGSTYTYIVNNGRKTVRFRSSRWSSFADGHPQFESVSSVLVSRVYSSLAQLVEQLTVNQFVAGSSPAGGARIRRGGRVAEGSGLLIRRTERFPGFESQSLCQGRVEVAP